MIPADLLTWPETAATEAVPDKGAARHPAKTNDAPCRAQVGALPYRFTAEGGLEYLLVTTRQSRRWTIPKGWPIKGMGAAEAAAREAYEEAGAGGRVEREAIGRFAYDKLLNDGGAWVSCEVLVFPLRVTRQRGVWPERGEREVRWFAAREAVAMVSWEGLADLMAAFASTVLAAPEADAHAAR